MDDVSTAKTAEGAEVRQPREIGLKVGWKSAGELSLTVKRQRQPDD